LSKFGVKFVLKYHFSSLKPHLTLGISSTSNY